MSERSSPVSDDDFEISTSDASDSTAPSTDRVSGGLLLTESDIEGYTLPDDPFVA